MNWLPPLLLLAAFSLDIQSDARADPAPSKPKKKLPAATNRKVDFQRDVQPILTKRCYECHGKDEQSGGLRLDRRDTALRGGDSGPAFVAGKSAASRLIRMVAGQNGDEPAMPPEGEPLGRAEIALLRAWIDQGAVRPVDAPLEKQPGEDHWAFQLPRRPPLPKVRNARWVRNPIDRFVLAKLEGLGIEPSPPADRATLIRRLSLDLLGLPPTPEEVDAFLADPRAGAYERVVDRMLASPHFGERLGRHWLDLARYADSDGYEDDKPRPDAWRYRDWVVDAINCDLPFDQFIIEQVAGDLLPSTGYRQQVAAGFHRMTLTNDSGGGGISEEFRTKAAKDRINTTFTVLLGLTAGCAQCHSHKYDPLTQREYYQLYAFFNSVDEVKISAPRLPTRYYDAYEKMRRAFDRRQAAAKAALAKWERNVERTKLPEDLAQLLAMPREKRSRQEQAQLAAHFSKTYPEYLQLSGAVLNSEQIKNNAPRPPSRHALTIAERSTPRRTAIHKRGDFTQPGATVQPGTPSFLPTLEIEDRGATRLDLARWIASPKNPLTSRVAVNYLWQYMFGQGLVRTPEDFGASGDAPTHPQLLDWLAIEFIEHGFRRKQLIRVIVGSATYRQSSRHRAKLFEMDQANRLLARQNRYRVEGEIVRDVALSVSGLLNSQFGGPSIQPPLPESLARDATLKTERFMAASEGADRYRRGVYINVQRTLSYPMLKTFDAADANVSCSRRDRSNTPLQALTLLNDPVFFECAGALARRLHAEFLPDDAARLRRAFRLCLGRKPDTAETATLARLLARLRHLYRKHPGEAAAAVGTSPLPINATVLDIAAWTGVARTLLNLDELLVRE